MLSLKCETPYRWLKQVNDCLPEILVDHAHCEKKAAGVAMNLLFAYVDNHSLTKAMTEIVQEELSHFHMVLDELARREIPFRRLSPSEYGRRLHEHVRKTEPGRAVDRLIVAGLIEARSCERFRILSERVPDEGLAHFYASLFESEARHHSTYIRLAKGFAPEDQVDHRLDELADVEASLIMEGENRPRMHS